MPKNLWCNSDANLLAGFSRRTRTGLRWGIVLRVVLGSYVTLHFASLLPWAAETFSNRGMLADGTLSPIPSLLTFVDHPAVIVAFVGVGAVAGVALALGTRDRIAAAVALAVSMCLFGRNPLIANPSLPYIGLLLFAWSASSRQHEGAGWSSAMLRALWVAMAVGYSYSGLTKLGAPSWSDGSAVMYILENPLARPGPIRDVLVAAPSWTLKLVTWATLSFEVAFAPLSLSARLRPWLWAGMLVMHLGLLVLVDFADLTLGMVVLHICTFDPRWVRTPVHRTSAPRTCRDIAVRGVQ